MKSTDTPIGNAGHGGTGREFWPHINRHSEPGIREKVAHEGAQLDRLFHSRDTGWGARNYIADMVPFLVLRLRGDLAIRAHAIPRTVLTRADRDLAQRMSGRRETVGHCWLKVVGALWLLDTLGLDSITEWTCSGYRHDVAVPDKRIILECGNTNVLGAIEAMRSPEPLRYFLLPYSNAASRWYDGLNDRHVFLFEMIISERGSAWLDREDEELLMGAAAKAERMD